jgi:hypothetical protein
LFVHHWLGEDDPDLTAVIHRQSEGNPLYIEEIVLWLQRGGGAARKELKQGLRKATSIQELVLSRVDGLPATERETARLAAVIGAAFGHQEVQSLREGRDGQAAALQDQLTNLQAAQLILLAQVGEDARYNFRQSLTREVLYDSQPFARRRELHGRLAQYLETAHNSRLIAHAERLAHHFERAELWLPAARYTLMAGNKARDRFAYQQAAANYRQVVALLARLPHEERHEGAAAMRLEAHELCGDVLLWDGDYEAAVVAYEAGLALDLDEILFAEARTWLMFKLALTFPLIGRDEDAWAWAEQGWERREPFFNLEALIIKKWLAWRQGKRANGLIEEIQPLITTDDPWRMGVLALSHYLAGDWAAAQKMWRRQERPRLVALALCREARHSDDKAEALALYQQAVELWANEEDKFAQALGLYRQAELRDGEGWGTAVALWRQSGVGLTWLPTDPAAPLPSPAWQFLEDTLLAAMLFKN